MSSNPYSYTPRLGVGAGIAAVLKSGIDAYLQALREGNVAKAAAIQQKLDNDIKREELDLKKEIAETEAERGKTKEAREVREEGERTFDRARITARRQAGSDLTSEDIATMALSGEKPDFESGLAGFPGTDVAGPPSPATQAVLEQIPPNEEVILGSELAASQRKQKALYEAGAIKFKRERIVEAVAPFKEQVTAGNLEQAEAELELLRQRVAAGELPESVVNQAEKRMDAARDNAEKDQAKAELQSMQTALLSTSYPSSPAEALALIARYGPLRQSIANRKVGTESVDPHFETWTRAAVGNTTELLPYFQQVQNADKGISDPALKIAARRAVMSSLPESITVDGRQVPVRGSEFVQTLKASDDAMLDELRRSEAVLPSEDQVLRIVRQKDPSLKGLSDDDPKVQAAVAAVTNDLYQKRVGTAALSDEERVKVVERMLFDANPGALTPSLKRILSTWAVSMVYGGNGLPTIFQEDTRAGKAAFLAQVEAGTEAAFSIKDAELQAAIDVGDMEAVRRINGETAGLRKELAGVKARLYEFAPQYAGALDAAARQERAIDARRRKGAGKEPTPERSVETLGLFTSWMTGQSSTMQAYTKQVEVGGQNVRVPTAAPSTRAGDHLYDHPELVDQWVEGLKVWTADMPNGVPVGWVKYLMTSIMPSETRTLEDGIKWLNDKGFKVDRLEESDEPEPESDESDETSFLQNLPAIKRQAQRTAPALVTRLRRLRLEYVG